jgi:hypothetical protein
MGDLAEAKRLVKALSDDVVVSQPTDHHGVGKGSESIMKRIRKQLDLASAVIVLVSEKSLDSPWVNFEIGAALGLDKVVIPIFLSRSAQRLAPKALCEIEGIVAEGVSSRVVAERVIERISELG